MEQWRKIEVPIENCIWQVLEPNVVPNCGAFYVSYNVRDTSIYGRDTTALVVGLMKWFLILNGDHRAQYSALIGKGLGACLQYFKENAALSNKLSDKLSLVNNGNYWEANFYLASECDPLT